MNSMTALELINTMEEERNQLETVLMETKATSRVVDTHSKKELAHSSNKIEGLANYKKEILKGQLIFDGKIESYYANTNQVFVYKHGRWEDGSEHSLLTDFPKNLGNRYAYQAMRNLHHLYKVRKESGGYVLSISFEGKEVERANPLLEALTSKVSLPPIRKVAFEILVDKNGGLLRHSFSLECKLTEDVTLEIEVVTVYSEKNKHDDFQSIPEEVFSSVGTK